MIRDWVAGIGFAVFVLLGVASAFLTDQERRAPGPPRRVKLVVLVGVGMSLLAGLSRRDLWPFAAWSLMPGMSAADVRIRALECADSAGNPFAVDYRAWSPLTEEELLAWLDARFIDLPPAQQDSARARLWQAAEAARRRVRAGGDAAPVPSPLGTLAAGSHLLHPKRWNRPDDAPAARCAVLRMVERRWNVDSVAARHGEMRTLTLWEYPGPR